MRFNFLKDILSVLGCKFNFTIKKGELDLNGPAPIFDEILVSYHGKFDEIFELPHIIRIICDLDVF